MEQPDAKFFQAFEQDVAGLEHDMSPIVQGLSTGVEAYYGVRWPNRIPYEHMRLSHFTRDELQEIGDELSAFAREISPQLADELHESDILTVSMDAGRLIYTTLDSSHSTFDIHELREGQQLHGMYRTMSIQGYLPESFDADEADDDVLEQEMHPLGLHLLLDSVVIDGLVEGDYVPSPNEIIRLPVHYRQLHVTKLRAPGE